eukprot:364410-Chlamydomonas_euryale.AAC.14
MSTVGTAAAAAAATGSAAACRCCAGSRVPAFSGVLAGAPRSSPKTHVTEEPRPCHMHACTQVRAPAGAVVCAATRVFQSVSHLPQVKHACEEAEQVQRAGRRGAGHRGGLDAFVLDGGREDVRHRAKQDPVGAQERGEHTPPHLTLRRLHVAAAAVERAGRLHPHGGGATRVGAALCPRAPRPRKLRHPSRRQRFPDRRRTRQEQESSSRRSREQKTYSGRGCATGDGLRTAGATATPCAPIRRAVGPHLATLDGKGPTTSMLNLH